MADDTVTYTTLESYGSSNNTENLIINAPDDFQTLGSECIQETESNSTESQPIESNLDDNKSNENNLFTCNVCNYQTENKLLLQRHVKIHNIDKPFKCPHCDHEFRDSIQLTNHVNIHLGFKPYQCDHCDLTFTTRGELVRHTRYRHTLEKPHKCSHCEYASVELSKLKRHLRTHTGERPYLCPHCDYASRDTFKLKRHIRIHTGEKPYECPICKSRFTQSNSLKSHLIVHRETEIVFTCKLCNAKFNKQNDLNKHIKQMHKEAEIGSTIPENDKIKLNPSNLNELEILQKQQEQIQNQITNWFTCSECNMKFSNKETLENHKVKHTGERPFQCHICGISFGQQFALRAHIKSHNRNNDKQQQQQQQHKDDVVIMNKIQEMITNVVYTVNHNEVVTSNSIEILTLNENNNNNNDDDDEIKNLLNEIIDKVTEMTKPKISLISKLLNGSVEKSKLSIFSINENIEKSITNEEETNKNSSIEIVKSNKLNESIENEIINIKIEKITQSQVEPSQKETINENQIDSTEKTVSTIDLTISSENGEKNEENNKKLKKEVVKRTKKTSANVIYCDLCSKFFLCSANLNKHLKEKHNSLDLITSGHSKEVKQQNSYDFLVSHLNVTALSQNYTGISRNSNDKLNISETKSGNNSLEGDSIDKTLDKSSNGNLSISLGANDDDLELLNQRRNETYSSLTKDITVNTKSPKKACKTRKTTKKLDPVKTAKCSAHLAQSGKDLKALDDPLEDDLPELPTPKKRASRKKPAVTATTAPVVAVDAKEQNCVDEKPLAVKTVAKRKRKSTKIEEIEITQTKNVIEKPIPVQPVNTRTKREASKRAKLNISNMIEESKIID